MANLKQFEKAGPPGSVFFWVTQHGSEIAIDEMSTNHLFNTLKMIWNHTAPPHLRWKTFKRYHLALQQKPDYFKKAARLMYAELMTRKLSDGQYLALRRMAEAFGTGLDIKQLEKHNES